jgi:hypothetical protein
MTKFLINQRRLDVARPFTVERTTSDAFGWKPKETAPAPVLPSVADLQKIKAKVEQIAEAVTERQAKAAESAEISALREHVKNYEYREPGPPRATHFRDRSYDPFFEMAITEAEERRRRRGA